MQDKLLSIASGKITIAIKINNKWEEVLTRSNTILPDAQQIIAKNLLQDPAAKIDEIKVVSGVTLKATGVISTYTYSAILGKQAIYVALFSTTSFCGNFDYLSLGSSGLGLLLAEVTGLTLSKLNTEQLLITWKITIA